MTIGDKIIKYCDEQGISTWEFAEKAGMTSVSITRLKKGDGLPNVPYLVKVANVLGITIYDMMGEHYQTLAEGVRNAV